MTNFVTSSVILLKIKSNQTIL